MTSTAELHLADLHALAAEHGIERYRLLRREELVERLAERGVEDAVASTPPPRAQREPREEPEDREERPRREPRQRRERSRGRREEPRDEAATETGDGEEPGDEELTPVSGIVDVLAARHGFLRLAGLEPSAGDVYISASQVRRCELRAGDVVKGGARPARRGERHPAMVHIDSVNGGEPEAPRPDFSAGTPVAPTRRIPLDAGEGEDAVVLRAIEALVPLAFGQRVLVDAPPRSGGTTLLRALARAARAAEGTEVTVVLVDERPEEVTAWREAMPDGVEIVAAPAEMRPREQARLAALALERAKRAAESGADSVLIVDSISRLAVAERDPGAAKRIFGAGRELTEPELGSLTVIATVLGGAGDPAGEAVRTTESATIALDPELARSGAFPALDVARSGASNESDLLGEAELEELRRRRGELTDLPPREAIAHLRERLS